MPDTVALIDDEEFLVDPHPVHARMHAALTDERLSKDPRNAWEPLRRAGREAGESGDAQLNMLLRDPPDQA